MRSGTLRYQVEVQKATTTVDAFGTPQNTWQTFATVRAEVVQRSTEEFLRNQGASDEQIVVFRTRYLDSISNADRILFEETAHNIKEIVPDPMRRHMEIRTNTVRAEA
jgi:SPP1 family predicted phage head-tail adaptor